MDHTRIAPTTKMPRRRSRALLIAGLATVVAGAVLLCSAIGIGRARAPRRSFALAYPTIRRKANVIGQPQAGTDCHLSANSGLPAIVGPGGFTADGLPVGVEMLGRAWSESLLISLAYAYEQATRHRRPPASTPALPRP